MGLCGSGGPVGVFKKKNSSSSAEFGSVPTTPDPNTSAKASRCKWEAYHDTEFGCVYTTFCQEKGILLQKYRDRNGRCIAILFKSIGVRGRCDSLEVGPRLRGRTSGDKRQSAVFCENLWFSAVSCENLRFSARICVSQMLCFLGEGENLQKSAKNLRLGSVCPLRFVPLSAP